MDRVSDILTFLAIAEHGSLSKAARHLGRSLQSVSRSLSLLERSLGVQLVQRTTRSCQLTEAGEAFRHRVAPAMAELSEAWDAASSLSSSASGTLRVSAPVLFAPAYIVPVVARYMERHPRVELELTVSDAFIDLRAQGLDLAVRIGEVTDDSLKARRLAMLRRVAFCSRSYVARHGVPAHPRELAAHRCVVRSGDGNDARWPFLVDGKQRRFPVEGRLRAGSTAAVNEAVVLGLGIGFGPLWQVRHLLEQRRLVTVLDRFEAPPIPVQAVWPAARAIPAKTRAFIDLLADHLGGLSL
ncbi:LysR family transcriptional regulator [Cupriavidus gilardii]|uniref:LysR family transcriptional regulator n=1 Tax=Cupriavidus gilardii TaxID=82541 RepID=UPI0021BF677D|nr:LysR family transcriptional regulator [Cupriavidus gilardii]MCT9126756.1 LysR family transcriptional regulator [Cupriavidus gilardii]